MVAGTSFARGAVQLLLAALATVMVGCSGTGGSAPSEPGSAERADPTEADRSVIIRARDDLSFDPARIEVRVGEVVTFEVGNPGASPHEFVLGDRRVQERRAAGEDPPAAGGGWDVVPLAPGETRRVTWRFTGRGVLEVACHLPGHYEAGMYTTIVVSD